MSSKPKQQPGFVREYLFDENGDAVLDEAGKQVWRLRPNRALKRREASLRKKGK
jgi:hypothetical protein